MILNYIIVQNCITVQILLLHTIEYICSLICKSLFFYDTWLFAIHFKILGFVEVCLSMIKECYLKSIVKMNYHKITKLKMFMQRMWEILVFVFSYFLPYPKKKNQP